MRCYTVAPEGVVTGITLSGPETGHSLFIGENGGIEVPLHSQIPPEVRQFPSGDWMVTDAGVSRTVTKSFPGGRVGEAPHLTVSENDSDERVLVRIELFLTPTEWGRATIVAVDSEVGDALVILHPGAVIRGNTRAGDVYYVALFEEQVMLLEKEEYNLLLKDGFIQEEEAVW